MWGGPREPREGLRRYCRCDRKPGARLGQGGDPLDGEWELEAGTGRGSGAGAGSLDQGCSGDRKRGSGAGSSAEAELTGLTRNRV